MHKYCLFLFSRRITQVHKTAWKTTLTFTTLETNNEENCRKLFQYVYPHLKEIEVNDVKLINKLPTLRDDNNLEYYSFLWRILLSKSLPIEIFDQTREFISNKNFTLTKFNQYFGSSNGQTRKPEFEQILQKSSLDLRLDYCLGKRYGDDRMMITYLSFLVSLSMKLTSHIHLILNLLIRQKLL